MSELMFIEKGTFLQKFFTDFLKIVSSSYFIYNTLASSLRYQFFKGEIRGNSFKL